MSGKLILFETYNKFSDGLKLWTHSAVIWDL